MPAAAHRAFGYVDCRGPPTMAQTVSDHIIQRLYAWGVAVQGRRTSLCPRVHASRGGAPSDRPRDADRIGRARRDLRDHPARCPGARRGRCASPRARHHAHRDWLSPRRGRSRGGRSARGVQIDLSPRMLSLRYPMEVTLHGGAAQTLRALLSLLERKPDRRWRAQIEGWVAGEIAWCPRSRHVPALPQPPSRSPRGVRPTP